MDRCSVVSRDAPAWAWLKFLSLGLLAGALSISAPCHAENADEIAALKSLLQETRSSIREMQSEYEKRIDALESRIQELESEADTATERTEALEGTTIEQQTLLEAIRSEATDRLTIHGYYDFQFIDADQSHPIAARQSL